MTESAPSLLRGPIVGMSTFQTSLGALFGILVDNYAQPYGGTASWKIPLGVMYVVPAFLTVLLVFLPDTPRFYVTRGQDDKAMRAISRLRGIRDEVYLRAEVEDIKSAYLMEQEIHAGVHLSDMFRGPDLRRTLLSYGANIAGIATGVTFMAGFSVYLFVQARVGYANGVNAAPSPEDVKLLEVSQKYSAEAAKRLRPDGLDQFVRLKEAGSERFRTLAEDPWADHAALNAREPVRDGSQYKFVILGAGYGGLLFAVRLIEAGLASGPDDIRFVDAAGGFGGTWWWNRYPGLHCDVESYSYMPLLEETGYVPSSKYVPGPELLEHADRIATQWKLHDKALFRASVKATRWDDAAQLWNVEVTEGRGPGEQSRELRLQAQYVLLASGILTNPHVPKIPELETFSGSLFHTARWDYKVTGGTPQDATLTGLEDKRVGVLGTGATAIQVVPKLAKYAKELYVFQRTPSSVSWRGQRPTDPEEWKTKIARKKGWQRERMLNLDSYLTDAAEEGQENMVADGWTEMPAFSAVIGSPRYPIVEPTPEKIMQHVGRLYKLDLPHTEAMRARTESIVKDPKTAAKLKAWYPTWCKRQCFSDEYLQAFNLPSVHLVDTDGKGVDLANASGLVVAGKEYPLDVLVLGTGYVTPSVGGGSPAARTGIEIYGRGGQSLDDKWTNHGASTLHGMCSNGFPNLFFTPLSQSGQAANNVLTLDVGVEHVAHIIEKAEAKAGGNAVVEVTSEAEEAWALEIMRRAGWFASVMGCTPGYVTSEGESLRQPGDQMEMAKKARGSGWTEGMESFLKLLQEYRADGSLRGFEVASRA